MSWNDQDPWKKKQDGPPNIDNIIKGFFSNKSQTPPGSPINSSYLSVVLVIFTILYVLGGFYIVKQPENAVVTRFGKIHKVHGSGLNWRPLFVDRVYLVNVDEILSFKKESQMLTKDENIVYIGVAIQYRRSDPIKFLFADQDPHVTIENVAESAIRQAIGLSKLDDILTTGKDAIKEFIKKDIKMTLNNYNIGLEMQDVNLTTVVPPKAVMEYFNDVTKAREDKFSTINEAERYRDSEIPIIQGYAEKIRAKARAYKEEKIFEATGETKKFELLLTEYQQKPEIFKRKLYFDTIGSVLSNTSKVLIDENAGQQFLYLPLDQMSQPNDIIGDTTDPNMNMDSLNYNHDSKTYQNDSYKKKNIQKRINLTAPAFSK